MRSTPPLLCELHAHTTWKTLLPAERMEAAVLAYLRSRDPVALTPFRPPAEAIRRAG